MITEFKIFEDNEETINRILDKMNKSGKDSLTSHELELLQNKGDSAYQEHFEKGDFEFEYIETEEYEDKIVVKGTLTYNGKEYGGSFTFPKTVVHEQSPDDKFFSQSNGFWTFYDDKNLEFEPEEDDFYDLDDLMQEVGMVYTDEEN